MIRLLAQLVCALLLTFTALPANAYTFIFDLGCAPNQGAPWRGNSEWYLHAAGYSKLPFEDVERIFIDSMDVWGTPCCSNWQNQYLGTTTGNANSNDSRHIIQFAETTWPREFGSRNSTIAVTLPRQNGRCELTSADMLFNGVGFTFVSAVVDRDRDTDLQSIATHEAGHWVGLDHSTASGSTMNAYYRGGESGRNLVGDDEAGVCALYPREACGCEASEDCSPGQQCNDGSCERVSCTDDEHCPSGSYCWEESCLPGCTNDAECGNEQVCRKNACVPDPTICKICNSCDRHSQCGHWSEGYYCAETMQGGRCTRECSSTADCDGDSVCRQVTSQDGGTFKLCLGALEGDLCPDEYECVGVEEGPGCTGLWSSCDRGPGSCQGNADICLQHQTDGAICSCLCVEDEECGAGASCVKQRQDEPGFCVPDEILDPCYGVQCDEGEVCRNGVCGDACRFVNCADGLVCEAGECVPDARRCGGVVCAPTETCQAGACVAIDSCAGVSCGEGKVCNDGECVATDDGPVRKKKKSGSLCSTAGGDPSLLMLLLTAAPFAAARRRQS